MKIKYCGHSAFVITTDKGLRIIVDPYQSGAYGGALAYGKITDEADVVLTSHAHDDHGYTKDIRGKFKRINEAGTYTFRGVVIRAIPTYHDASEGKERGSNLFFVIEADGFVVAHAGDLGHTLQSGAVKDIGRVDVLLLPVGGFYTIDATQAARVVDDLKPRIIIPMHFKTDKCDFPISSVEEFTKDRRGVRVSKSSELAVSKATLPEEPETVVLQYAL